MVKHPINFTMEEFNKEQAIKKFYFAKWCASTNRHEVFKDKYNQTLREYKEEIDHHKRRKHEASERKE